MQTFYKIFLVLLVISVGFCFYGIDWNLGFMHEENTKFLISIAAGLLGVILVFVMNTWSRLSPSNK